MRIEKGIVKDQGYPDYELTYGIMDDGTQYYFINEGMLDNGNIIASVVLKEAIGHAKNTKLGLINKDGDILIPFDNKVIKLIDNKYLLVEKNDPTDQNVLDAIKVKSDPLAATKLVTNAASIKEKVTSNMKELGRFLFNDQFSEATIFDIDGNNIINNEYFSFIGYDTDGFVFSKNTFDTELATYKFNGVAQEKVDDTEVVEEVPSINLDIANMKIDNDTVNNAVEDANLEETGIFDLGLTDSVEEVVPVEVPVNDNIELNIGEEVSAEEVPVDISVDTNESVEDIYSGVVRDSIIEDVGSTMKKLIEQNKSQRTSILNKDEEITSLRDDNRELHNLCTKQTRELSSFKDKVIKFENIVSKLEGRNQMITAQLEDLEKEKAYFEEQLSILKPQVAGKETLVTLLDEANEALGDF